MPQYTPDGLWELDEAANAWVPRKVVAPPPPPPPPAPPAPPAPPPAPPAMPAPLPGMTAFVPPPMAAPSPYAHTQVYAPAGDEWDLVAEAGEKPGVPLGLGFVILVEDVELSIKEGKKPRINVQGKTLQPNGNTPAGTKVIWGYTLPGQVFKLGRDLVPLGITKLSKNEERATQELSGYLRTKVLLVDSEPQQDSNKYTEVTVKGFYNPTGAHAASAEAAAYPPAAPPAPPTAPSGYGVSFPPPPGAGFKAV